MDSHEPIRKQVLQGQCVWPISPTKARVEGDAILYSAFDDPFQRPEGAYYDGPVIEYEPVRVDGIITPAFCDWHFHWVQHRIRGASSAPLLQWLEDKALPEEARYSDPGFAAVAAEGFRRNQVAAGTLSGCSWGSPDPGSVLAAKAAGVRAALSGPALMTRDGPGGNGLARPIEQALSELSALYGELGASLMVAPRFALSCGAEDLAALGKFAADNTLWVHTHLAENQDECAAVAHEFKEAKSYVDVYDQAGLLTPRTLLAHCIHLDDFDWRTIKRRGSIVVHCPTANEVLGSGRMPLEKVRAMDIPWVLGSDIGAGPDLCMMAVVEAATRVHDWHAPVTAVEAFFRATVSLKSLEAYASRKTRVTRAMGAARAGFIEFRRPTAIDRGDRDPEQILLALIDAYKSDPDNAITAVYDSEFNRVDVA